MSDNIKELVKRLRDRREYQSRGHGEVVDVADGDCSEAADALEAMAKYRADYEAMKAHNKELFGKLSAAEAERDRLKAALEVPEVWSVDERDGLADVWREASRKHGHYETLFAIAAWLLRSRARKALGGAAS